MIAVAIIQKTNAEIVVTYGLLMVIGLAMVDWILPVPSTITETAAPKAPAFEIPRVNGDPRGLRRMDCMTTPATDRPTPATMAVSAWGSRIFQIIASHLWLTF